MPATKTLKPSSEEASAVILGIDPGSLFTGYGLVRIAGDALAVIEAGRLSLSQEAPMPERLVAIYDKVSLLVERHKPAAMALEDLFTFKNPRSALKLAQARAAALLAGARQGLSIFEYSPSLVKKTVAGSGRAPKEQVAFMVGKILGLSEELPPDASDALAVAICHAGQSKMAVGASPVAAAAAGRARASSWRRLSAQDLAALGYRLERNP